MCTFNLFLYVASVYPNGSSNELVHHIYRRVVRQMIRIGYATRSTYREMMKRHALEHHDLVDALHVKRECG